MIASLEDGYRGDSPVAIYLWDVCPSTASVARAMIAGSGSWQFVSGLDDCWGVQINLPFRCI